VAFQARKRCLRSKAAKAVCMRPQSKHMPNGWNDNLRIIDPTQTITTSIIAIVTHVICVGLPISLMVRRYSVAR